MTSIITGGAGYIGSHLALLLKDKGETVHIIDRESPHRAVEKVLPGLFFKADIANKTDIAEIFKIVKPDKIYHLAGSIIVSESVEKPSLYYDNNTGASASMLSVCHDFNIRKVIFASTAAVYGAPTISPIPESAPLKPVNPYGMSKLFVEQILSDADKAGYLKYAALRFFNVIGADPSGRIGQLGAKAYHIVKASAATATGQQKALSIFGTDYDTPDGTCVRDYIHVWDLVEALYLAGAALDRGAQSMTLNVGDGKGVSVLDIVNAASLAIGHSLPTVPSPRRMGDPPILIADPSLIHKTLNWSPKLTDINKTVKQAIDWEKQILSGL